MSCNEVQEYNWYGWVCWYREMPVCPRTMWVCVEAEDVICKNTVEKFGWRY